MPYVRHDGLDFHYRDEGIGMPFVFQHGLGGDVNQPFGLFVPPPGIRLIALDCRAHGETRPIGEEAKIGLASFADDVCALLNHLALPQVIIGGISMGAAVALNIAVRFPKRVRGLVLSRPAWLDQPNPPNGALFPLIARLIRQHGAVRGLEVFKQSAEYAALAAAAPDAARSACGQFLHPRAEEAVARLERIQNEAPNRDRQEWTRIAVPTLVLANRQDPIHPFSYGETLASLMPRAELREITSKSLDPVAHVRQTQAFIAAFLAQHFGISEQ